MEDPRLAQVECEPTALEQQLDLCVAVTQPAAKRVYESLGFSAYGRERRSLKVGDG